MKKKKDKKAISKKKPKKTAVNDIIQKIVDIHATVDQRLAEMSSVAHKRDCEK